MNRKDLQALTLVGPTRDNQYPDPLAVLHLDNQLYMQGFVSNIHSQYCTALNPRYRTP